MSPESKNILVLLLFFATFLAIAVFYSVEIDQASRQMIETGRIPASDSHAIGADDFASLI